MLASLIYDIKNELDLIEGFVTDKRKKYGNFDFNGKFFSCIDKQEEEFTYSGQKYFEGYAICDDEIHFDEALDGAEKLEDVDFWLPVYKYETDEYGNVESIYYSDMKLWDQEKKEA